MLNYCRRRRAPLDDGAAGPVGHGNGDDQADDAYHDQDVPNQDLVQEGDESGGEREGQDGTDGDQGNGRTDSHNVLLMFVQREVAPSAGFVSSGYLSFAGPTSIC